MMLEVFRLIMYLTMISVECDERLEIVHVHPSGGN